MQRRRILKTVASYRELWLSPAGRHATFDRDEEERILERFTRFIEATPDCFERTCPPGHVTGSALVVSPDFDQVLLTLHGKLGLWLQLGGHADGSPQIDEVALREVHEESGLQGVRFLKYESVLEGDGAARTEMGSPLPFDFDAHQIPARAGEPAHIHYDVRYAIVADPAEPLVISSESKDLRWFRVAEARRVTAERSMHRQFDKLAYLATRLTATGAALG